MATYSQRLQEPPTTVKPAPQSSERTRVKRLERSPRWVSINASELWDYRELLYFLIWRDIKVRYKQTALGAAWAIIQPVFTMVVFSIFFGKLAKMPSDGLPYPIFSFAALVPWTFFANSLSQSSASLVGSSSLVTKVYFPRLIIPVAPVIAGLVDFSLAFVVLLVMMFSYGIVPTANIIWLPAFMALAIITSLGVSLWLSALNTQYRDIQYVLPFLIQVWMYSTPIVYSSNLLSGWKRTIYGINPMAGVVEGFRWALLGTNSGPGPMIAVSILASLLLLAGGVLYFRRMESSFADVI